jgi:hypothetical protein
MKIDQTRIWLNQRAERAGLKNYRLYLLVAVGFDDVVRASSKEHVAAAAIAAAASADKLPSGLRSFQAVEGQSV